MAILTCCANCQTRHKRPYTKHDRCVLHVASRITVGRQCASEQDGAIGRLSAHRHTPHATSPLVSAALPHRAFVYITLTRYTNAISLVLVLICEWLHIVIPMVILCYHQKMFRPTTVRYKLPTRYWLC